MTPIVPIPRMLGALVLLPPQTRNQSQLWLGAIAGEEGRHTHKAVLLLPLFFALCCQDTFFLGARIISGLAAVQ